MPELLRFRKAHPRDRSRLRVDKVLAFVKAEATPQFLRRTALALQLVGHVNRICGQLGSDPEPLLVRLAKGAVERVVVSDLARIIGDLHLDPGLDVGACLAVLLATAMDLLCRFRHYAEWPYAAWALCRKFNPDGYIVACSRFLEADEAALDMGLGVPLLQLARRQGGNNIARLQWLMGDAVQVSLCMAFQSSAASSLPVERAFAETKRSEAPRLCHVSTAGRNQILKQYLRDREEVLEEAELAAAAMRRSAKANLQSLACELRPDLAFGGGEGTGASMRDFIEANRGSMQEELRRRKESARRALERASAKEVPVSHADWVDWLDEHEDEFAELMRTATARRRMQNRRLEAAPDVPAGVRRLAPIHRAADTKHLSAWAQRLWGRSGWHCALVQQKGVRLLFLLVWHQRTYALDLSECQVGREYVVGVNDCAELLAKLQPLEDLDFGGVREVREALMSTRSVPGAVRFCVKRCRVLAEPLAKRRAAKRRQAVGEAEEDEADSDAEVVAHIADDVGGRSDGEESGVSVDTDQDSGLDDLFVSAQRLEDNPDAGVSDLEEEGVDDGDDALAGGEDGSLAPAQLDEGGPRYRHPAGTWTVWDNLWFYMTRRPGFFDIKIWIKSPLRNSETGMGVTEMSKTVRPRHYGDSEEDPWRCKFVLRAWALWRARQNAWTAAKPCRARELARQQELLVKDMRLALGDRPQPPLLGTARAHNNLLAWAPQVVELLLQRPSA
jgi:hypothetical protein